mmetsp:Transcript_2509/g.3483  ORF Transcript_2509/g.3483 Transcript_2509/m.3483 type:complete len:208 (-) Transcript_2509:215-838(-)
MTSRNRSEASWMKRTLSGFLVDPQIILSQTISTSKSGRTSTSLDPLRRWLRISSRLGRWSALTRLTTSSTSLLIRIVLPYLQMGVKCLTTQRQMRLGIIMLFLMHALLTFGTLPTPHGSNRTTSSTKHLLLFPGRFWKFTAVHQKWLLRGATGPHLPEHMREIRAMDNWWNYLDSVLQSLMTSCSSATWKFSITRRNSLVSSEARRM